MTVGQQRETASVVLADRSLDRSGAGGDVLSSWAEKLSGRAAKRARGVLRFAFYGRVSTEDWQDPVTSRARQLQQAMMLAAAAGVIVAEFFDRARRTRSRTRRIGSRAARHRARFLQSVRRAGTRDHSRNAGGTTGSTATRDVVGRAAAAVAAVGRSQRRERFLVLLGRRA
jgi:hypothetical protein